MEPTFLEEIDSVFGGGAAHNDQADAASGAHEVLAAGEYGRIGRGDYPPIEWARRPFGEHEGRGPPGDVLGR